MSRFRPDRAFISVERHGIALVMLPEGASEPAAERVIDVVPGGEALADALDTLATVLSEKPWRDTERHVVLSDRFARYAVLDRPAQTRSLKELRLAVEARFEETFDVPSSAWRLALHVRPFAEQLVACGLPVSLVQSVERACSTTGRCVSLSPFLVCELNRCARRLPGACWFAAGSRDCVSVARISSAECARIRVLPVQAATTDCVTGLLERERVLLGDAPDEAPCYFSGVLAGDEDIPGASRLDRPRFGSLPAEWTPLYRVALAEVWQ